MFTIDKQSLLSVAKFIGVFLLLYCGTYALIAVTTPHGFYIKWIDDYFNYVKWFRKGLLHAAKAIMMLFGYDMKLYDPYTLGIRHSNWVRLVYSCLGIGVISFWTAFVTTNKGALKFKLKWLVGGIALIVISNIVRICLLLVAAFSKWKTVLNIDHHTAYNILSYLIIILLVYFYNKKLNAKLST